MVKNEHTQQELLEHTDKELLDAQYSDRQHLRPVYDRVAEAVRAFPLSSIDVRDTHVSFETNQRQFAVIKPTTPAHIDLALRLPGEPFTERFASCGCALNSLVTHQVSLQTLAEVDDELVLWLRKAYVAQSPTPEQQ